MTSSPPPDARPAPEPAPGASLRLTLTASGSGPTVLAAAGEVDLATRDEFATSLRAAVDASPQHVVVVDLDGVGFLGACGLTALLDAHHHAGRRGGQVRLALAGTAPVTSVLQFLPPGGPAVQPTVAAALGTPGRAAPALVGAGDDHPPRRAAGERR